jgi:hypothetical protein
MSILTQISSTCRQTTLEYLETAENRKTDDSLSMLWYMMGWPHLALIFHNRWAVAATIFSLAVSLAYAIAEQYPGGVTKPKELAAFTAVAAAIKIACHIGMYNLAGNSAKFRKYGRTSVVANGCVAAVLKGIECIMICLLVDKGIPKDRNGRFCMCAQASAEGLLAIAVGMSYAGPDVVAFDRPGGVFEGFGCRYCYPALTTDEKRALIEALMHGEVEQSNQLRATYADVTCRPKGPPLLVL